MLQSIRDSSQGIVAKIIVGLIIVTFALFGVESLVTLTGGSNAPATVNGEEISESALLQSAELQRRQILSRMGENADPSVLDTGLIRSMALENLIDETALIQYAKQKEMMVSESMIDQMILNTTEFQVDGRFDRNLFEATLRGAGFTPLSYRDLLAKETLVNQERSGFMLSAFATDYDVNRLVELDRQKRDLSYFVLPAASVAEEIVPDEQQLLSYFQENQAQYQSDEEVSIEYLLLNRDELAQGIEVEAADLEQSYQALVANFTASNEYHSAHILLEVAESDAEADVLAKAQSLKKRLDEGEDFAALAKEASADIGSAESGGDLGFNPSGVFVPEFDEALASLKKGEVSEPVRTEFGYHLIKLMDTRATLPPSFEEAEAGLRADLVEQESEARYVSALEKLADISFSAGDLIEPSEELGLPIQTTESFSQLGGSDFVTTNPKVIKAAFDESLRKEGLNSTPIELDSRRAVVIRIKEHQPARPMTLDEVKEEITDSLKGELILAKLNQRADEILEQLASGSKMQEVAADFEVKEIKGVSRNQADLDPQITQQLFRMPKPEQDGSMVYSRVELADSSIAIVSLTAIEEGSSADISDQERAAMKRILASRAGQLEYAAVVQSVRDAAKIERK